MISARRYDAGRHEDDPSALAAAAFGLAGLADHSHRPLFQPRQIGADVEELISQLRTTHPRWGPRRLAYELDKASVLAAQSTVDGRPGAGLPRPGPGPAAVSRGSGRGSGRSAKVFGRGGIHVARQHVPVGFSDAGKTVTIELGDIALRVIDQHGELITTVPCNSTGESAFKAHGASAGIGDSGRPSSSRPASCRRPQNTNTAALQVALRASPNSDLPGN